MKRLFPKVGDSLFLFRITDSDSWSSIRIDGTIFIPGAARVFSPFFTRLYFFSPRSRAAGRWRKKYWNLILPRRCGTRFSVPGQEEGKVLTHESGLHSKSKNPKFNYTCFPGYFSFQPESVTSNWFNCYISL